MITMFAEGENAFILSDDGKALLRCNFSTDGEYPEIKSLEKIENFEDPFMLLHCALIRAVLAKFDNCGKYHVVCKKPEGVMLKVVRQLKFDLDGDDYCVDTYEFFTRKCDGCGPAKQ